MTTKTASSLNTRSTARATAVQAGYQWLMQGGSITPVILEFIEHRQDSLQPIDNDYFRALLTALEQRFADVKGLVEPQLDPAWSLARMDKVLQAIAFLGVAELLTKPEIPTKVIINEYITIAKTYYDGRESAFINRLLDSVAKAVRVT